MKTVWGFGGIYFVGIADFTTSTGTIRIMQEGVDRIAKDGTYDHRIKGYRARISVKLWNSASDGSDAVKIANLLDTLSALEGKIAICPRYNLSSGSTLQFNVVCVSDYAMIDVANVAVGQYIELEFVELTRSTSIPTLLSDPSTLYIVDENANSVVDENGNKLTGVL